MLTSLSDVRESCQQLIVRSFVPVFLPVRDCPVFLTVVIAMDVPQGVPYQMARL